MLVTLGSGCSSTRYVTPWLRVTVYKPFELIAESGGPKPTYVVEQRLEHGWTEISDSPFALGLLGGKKAVYDRVGGYVLTDEAGTSVVLPCAGSLYAPPAGAHLDCFEGSAYDEPPSIRWRRFDLAAEPPAVQVAKLSHSTKLRDELRFQGYGEDGVPRFVHSERDRVGRTTSCELLRAETDGTLTSIASATPDGPWDCIEAEFWRKRAGVEMVR